MAALKRIDRHVEHSHVVGHEERIELCPLEHLDGVSQVGEVEIHVWPCAGIPPRASVDACRPHERTKVELTRRCHVRCPAAGSRRCGVASVKIKSIVANCGLLRLPVSMPIQKGRRRDCRLIKLSVVFPGAGPKAQSRNGPSSSTLPKIEALARAVGFAI